jgi:hypothetical protein
MDYWQSNTILFVSSVTSRFILQQDYTSLVSQSVDVSQTLSFEMGYATFLHIDLFIPSSH